MLEPPTRTMRVAVMPVPPAVLPPVETPAWKPGTSREMVEPLGVMTSPVPTADSDEVAGALKEMVAPAAPVVCESEMGPVPTKTMREPVTPVLPAVFPIVEIPAENAPPAPVAPVTPCAPVTPVTPVVPTPVTPVTPVTP